MQHAQELSALLADVRSYGASQADLLQAHHFLFCKTLLRNPQANNIVVMGINPGETSTDWASTGGQRSEESFERDFHEAHRSAASKKWMSNINFFLPDHNIYLTELFFWSSSNIVELEARYGKLNAHNPHAQFCKTINTRLIELIRPAAVIFTGVTYFKTVASIYGLEPSQELLADKQRKLAVLASSGHCPWIFTRHWSGSFGFSQSDKAAIKAFIAAVTQQPAQPSA